MVIASPIHPLVIFIDDIHLADMGSLEIIEDIISNDSISGLLIISCYRDNEVNEDHPLIQSIRKVKSREGKIERLHLKNLERNAVAQMIADIIRCPITDCIELVETVFKKTHGNPFYMIQFLKYCHYKQFISFNFETKTWQYNIRAIEGCPVEDNVVDFLVTKIIEFPAPTLYIAKNEGKNRCVFFGQNDFLL